MKRLSIVLLAVLLLPGCKGQDESAPAATATRPASQPASAPALDPERAARDFVEQLGRRDFAGAAEHLSPEVKKSIDAAKLQEIWDQNPAAAGTFTRVSSTSVIPKGKHTSVVVRIDLTAGDRAVLIGFVDGDPHVSTMRLPAAEAVSPYQAPDYVDTSRFDGRDVMVGKGPMTLPGTLLVPHGAGPFPALILIDGSGGGDRDDTIAALHPFRDVAEGLASRGLVVLRYEKRTHLLNTLGLPIAPANITVREEYLDDVAAAIDFVRAVPQVDPKHVFLLGHSEGGWLIPWFLKLHPEVTGGITFAGLARPFGDIIPGQHTYLAKLNDGKVDALEQAAIDAEVKKAARTHDPKLPLDTSPADLPFGAAAPYWLSLQEYDAEAVAHALPQPLLILQGERDYNVTPDDDFALWKKALSDKGSVEFKLYPKLNHAFCPGEGPIMPAEYGKVAHVEKDVIEDIAAWAGRH